MLYKIEMLTTEREHLFDVSWRLFSSIPLAFLSDPQNPVLVSVDGGFGGGKKIIPDAAVEKLLGGTKTRMTGKKEYDEYWSGVYQGLEIEIDFVNSAWGRNYGRIFVEDHHYLENEDVTKQFLSLREKGGVSFVHNDDCFSNVKADIVIWIEETRKNPVADKPRHSCSSALKDAFYIASEEYGREKDKDWVRYVEIEVRRKDLLASPEFLQGLASIAALAQIKNAIIAGDAVQKLTKSVALTRRALSLQAPETLASLTAEPKL